MRARVVAGALAGAVAASPGCGGATAQPQGAPPKLLHSPELNEIMKNEVNQPFSALMYLVFHAADSSDDGELDYAKIDAPVSTLRTGIAKVRAMVNPPVETAEAREVFITYVDSLVRDSEQLADALAGRDRPRMQTLLKKITHTCNNCHHFFRLKVVDETGGAQATSMTVLPGPPGPGSALPAAPQ